MDESSAQLLHEHQQAKATTLFNSMSEESAINPAAISPALPTISSATLPSNQNSPSQPNEFNNTGHINISSPLQGAPSNTMEALKSSLLSGKFSDLTIIQGSRTWKAHQVVVCSQSSALDKIIDKIPLENGTKVLNLTDSSFGDVVHLMDYLYTTNYSTNLTDIAPYFSLNIHIQIFDLATRLQVPGLQNLASQKFRYALSNHVRSTAVYFFCIRQIYNTTSKDNPVLRLAVIEAAVSEISKLVLEPDFLRLLNDVPVFQIELLETLGGLAANGINRAGDGECLVEFVADVLCEECGPRNEDDGYEVITECKGCGKKRTLEFL